MKAICSHIDLHVHKKYLLIGNFLVQFGKNVGICHWDRGFLTAPETPEKNPWHEQESAFGKERARVSNR